jgi:hypothetical protein
MVGVGGRTGASFIQCPGKEASKASLISEVGLLLQCSSIVKRYPKMVSDRYDFRCYTCTHH